MQRVKVRHVVVLVVGVLVLAWIAAHLLLVAFVSGGLLGYVLGKRHGRSRAILDAAKKIVDERARTLGSLWSPRT